MGTLYQLARKTEYTLTQLIPLDIILSLPISPKATVSVPSLLVRLWVQVSYRRRLQLLALFLLMIAVSFAEVVSIGAVLPFLGVLTSPELVFKHSLVQPAIKIFGWTEPRQLLGPLTILFVSAAIFSGALRLTLNWAQIRLSYTIGADFSISIYRRTLYQEYSVHIARNSSEIISGVTTKADGIVHQTILPLLVIISSVSMLTAILLTLTAIQPFVAFSAFGGFGCIYAFVIYFTRARLVADGGLISRIQTVVIKALQEALGGIRDVIIDGTQDVYIRIYQDADHRLRRAQSNISIVSTSPRFIVEAIGVTIIALIAYSLAEDSQEITTAIPILGALALGAQRMLPVLQQAYSSWSTMRGGHFALVDALEFLEQPMPSHVNAPPPLLFQSELQLTQLGFRYAEHQPWVFRDLSLKIAKGSRTGFIGTTGSGKSTLLDIVMGLLVPTEGFLKLDEEVITPKNCRAWQAHIAHVPQSIFLADATIAENIAFGVPTKDINLDRVRSAAERAQIASSVESWSDGYNTRVGERGVRLSGGQRQRIGIARALYKNADVIIFDEATSALDSETESAVMESIQDLSKELTILMVAHRLTTLRGCSKIVELSGGKIKRVGPYQEIFGSRQTVGKQLL